MSGDPVDARPLLQPSQRWWDDGDVASRPDPDPRDEGTAEPSDDGGAATAREAMAGCAPSVEAPAGGRASGDRDNPMTKGVAPGSTAVMPGPPSPPSAGPLESVADVEPDPVRTGGLGAGTRRAIVVAVCASLAVAGLSVGGVFAWRAWQDARAEDVRSSCLDAASSQSDAWESVSGAVEAAGDAEGIDASEVQDASTVSDLARLLDSVPEAPTADACPVGATAELLAARRERAASQADAYARYAKDLESAVSAVLASRDAKTLKDAEDALKAKADQAAALLADSDGKVQDNATRDSLRQAIDQARELLDVDDDAKAMNDASAALDRAMTAVNDSVKAKEDADAKAAAEAAAAAQAAQQAQQSYAPSYSGGGYSGGYSGGGSAPSYSGGGSASTGGSSSGGSTPSWSVPPVDDRLPGSDPSL